MKSLQRKLRMIVIFGSLWTFQTAMALTKAETLVATEVTQNIQKLQSNTTVYNYVDANNLQAYSPDLEAGGVAYLKDSSDGFWVLDQDFNPNSMLGDGLFTALDPLVSQSYGGSNFALIAIQLPAGLNYLHLSDIWQNQAIAPALSAEGCNVEAAFAMLLQSRDPVCHQIALNVLTSLKSSFDAVLYPWYAARLNGCSRGQEALLITNSALLTAQNTTVYTEGGNTDKDPQNQMAMEKLFRTPGIDTQNQAYHSLWPSLKIDPKLNLQTWMKRTLLGCQ